MYSVSGPSPWKKPLPVYISSPAPPVRSQTQALSAPIQSSLSFFFPHSVYLPSHSLFSHHRQNLTCVRLHTHTHTDHRYIHSTRRMLCHCRPVLLNHSCKPPPSSFPCVFHHYTFLLLPFLCATFHVSISILLWRDFTLLQFSGH